MDQKFGVKYEDNTGGGDSVEYYDTEDAAEEAIEEELESVKEYYQGIDYDYGDFGDKTEFWVSGQDEYACWTRLWKE